MAIKQYSILLLIFSFCLKATDYYYPVGFSEHLQTIFYIHQTEPLNIDLYSYDIGAQEHTKLLPGYFNPAGFRLLPNDNAFSFIHNDTIYIKYFCKRSPKRLEFFEPIYGINTIEWIDMQSFYFAARQHRHYRIYEGNTLGDFTCLASEDTADLMWPQKIDDILFYIERSNDGNFSIIRHSLATKYKIIIADLGATSIAFLLMRSRQEGFFIAYPSKIYPQDEQIRFSYYHLFQKETWQTKRLFDFLVPSKYLVDGSQERLYESITPFVPHSNSAFLQTDLVLADSQI